MPKTRRELDRDIAEALALKGQESFQIGRDEPAHRPQYQKHPLEGPGDVYLTTAQRKKLFGKSEPGQVLGRGKYASVYETDDPRRVVKLTHDESDAAALVRAQRTGVVPKLHEAYKLAQPSTSKYNGTQRPVYALVLERLTPVPPEHDADVLPALGRLRKAIIAKPTGPIGIRGVTAPGPKPCETERCVKAAHQLVRAVNRLRAVGIPLTDLNVMNLGYGEDGTMRVLDVGANAETPGKLPVLAHARKVQAPQRTARKPRAQRGRKR